MVNFCNPWQQNYQTMNKEMEQIMHDCGNAEIISSFIQKNGQEYFRGGNHHIGHCVQDGRIYRVEGWGSWIKYKFLKNFSREWSECILQIGVLSERLLIPREKKLFFLDQNLGEAKMFIANHMEDLSGYENTQGEEKIYNFEIYRAKNIFTRIKYNFLKRCSAEWQELQIKVEAVSEKFLVKKRDALLLIRLHLDGKPIFFE